VDYVQKDRLARLPNTVQRVLEEKRLRTENKRAEEALRRASAHDRTLVEASLDPLVFISPAGRISDVNEATVKLTGVPREKLIGTDFSSYFTEPERARAVYRKVFEKGFVTNYELTIRHVEGHLTHVLYNASVYTDTEGSALGVFAAARDITERKRAEGKIQKLNEQLEQRVRERTAELESANKELEAFTYSVSHDLRAPLRHVEGFSKLLVEKHRAELSPDVQEYLATIRDSVLQMGRLIDDLLNLARVGRTQLSMQATGLNSLVEEVRTDLDRANPERLIAWKIETLPFVECDPALIKQVFANLLSNAVKFTRPRKPALIEVGVASQDGARAVFVRDNGVGFSMKYAHKLFGVFQRLHREEDFEGTGVGLATVQRIIHKHGGRVWAEAELDKGATFYFTLGSSDDPQPEEPTDSGGNA
jgi:PAS domain S-box-containing protein